MLRIDKHDINNSIQGTLAGPLSAGWQNPPESDRTRWHMPHSADVLSGAGQERMRVRSGGAGDCQRGHPSLKTV